MKAILLQNRIIYHLRSLLAPPACESCGRWVERNEVLCSICERNFLPLSASHCEVCALPFEGEALSPHRCAECLREPPSFSKVHAAFEFSGTAAALLRSAKFGKRERSLQIMAQKARFKFQDVFKNYLPDFVIPMPLSWRRRIQRGFNQSHRLTYFLLKDLKSATIPTFLLKRRHTPPQSGKGREERLKALRGVFSLPSNVQVKDKRLLLVDDVLTTGATAHAISRILRKAGAEEIQVFVVARVRRMWGN